MLISRTRHGDDEIEASRKGVTNTIAKFFDELYSDGNLNDIDEDKDDEDHTQQDKSEEDKKSTQPKNKQKEEECTKEQLQNANDGLDKKVQLQIPTE